MKKTTIAITTSALLAIPLTLFVGCSALGTNPGPPSGLEKILYNTQTNYVPIVQVVTNQQIVTVTHTNFVEITNAGVIEFHTNVVTVQQTNQVPATNITQQAQYTENLKPGVSTIASTIGGVVNTFFPGIGAIGVQGLLAALGTWGYLRSSKKGDTNAALAQEIESIRAFIQKLPNGAAYDAAFVNFMQAHQNEAGVGSEVLGILAKEVSNPDAQVAAQQMQTFLQQLQASVNTPPPPPPIKVP
jgi:hypothetical protein